MRLDSAAAQLKFAHSRVARLATVTVSGDPHLVPLVFAVDGQVVYSAVDAKPKTRIALQRLANIAANPQVSLLADQYSDDWERLWWVRADGLARLAEGEEAVRAVELLTARYEQYVMQPPPGPVLAVDVRRWSGWAAGPGALDS